jgi:ribosome maturation factor RimP
LGQPIEGRKRFRGRLLGRAADLVRIVAETGEVTLPFTAIIKAKLVITPELLAARSLPLH